MKKIGLIILILIIVPSCDNPKVEYFKNGNISKEYRLKNRKFDGIYKEFYPDGNIKLTHHYVNGVKVDSSIYFQKGHIQKIDYYKTNDTLFSIRLYPNLKKKEEGNFFKGNKIGKWSYYNYKGQLEKVFEYINLNGIQYTNQGWFIGRIGDTLLNKSNFYKLKVKKNVLNIKEQTTVTIFYNTLFKNTVSGLLLNKENLINDDYSNWNEHNVDTLYFVDNKLQFSIGFKDKGHKNLGGYILEMSEKPSADGSYYERKIYLSIPLDVK